MKDPNKPKKVKAPIAKPEPVDHATLTRVLNVMCRRTNQLVRVNEYVKIFDLGDIDNLIGVGRFTWNKEFRCFDFSLNQGMTESVGKIWFGLGSHDAFFAPIEKLTPEELNEIVMPNL